MRKTEWKQQIDKERERERKTWITLVDKQTERKTKKSDKETKLEKEK